MVSTNAPYSQERLQQIYNRRFSITEGKEVNVTILSTEPLERTGQQEWQSKIRYVDQEDKTVEREVIFVMDGEEPCIHVVTEQRRVSS